MIFHQEQPTRKWNFTSHPTKCQGILDDKSNSTRETMTRPGYSATPHANKLQHGYGGSSNRSRRDRNPWLNGERGGRGPDRGNLHNDRRGRPEGKK